MMKTVSLIVLIAAGNFLLAWIAAFLCMWAIDKKPHRLTIRSNDDIRFFVSFFSLFVAVEALVFHLCSEMKEGTENETIHEPTAADHQQLGQASFVDDNRRNFRASGYPRR